MNNREATQNQTTPQGKTQAGPEMVAAMVAHNEEQQVFRALTSLLLNYRRALMEVESAAINYQETANFMVHMFLKEFTVTIEKGA